MLEGTSTGHLVQTSAYNNSIKQNKIKKPQVDPHSHMTDSHCTLVNEVTGQPGCWDFVTFCCTLLLRQSAAQPSVGTVGLLGSVRNRSHGPIAPHQEPPQLWSPGMWARTTPV